MVLRTTFDVNVWVNHYLALSRGRTGSSAQLLVQGAFAGFCRLGPMQPVLSHAMLDTLEGVLVRLGLPEPMAEAARDAVEACAIEGVVRQAPYVVLGGGVQPLRDAEDRGVLDTAIAGGSHLLVTNNIADFSRGARADIDTAVIRVDRRGKPDVLLFTHGKSPVGLVVASVFAAREWLVEGIAPPKGILEGFLPPPSSKSDE